MKDKAELVLAVALALSAAAAHAAVPQPQGVPEMMTTFDGRRVADKETWERVRRPELLDRFLEARGLVLVRRAGRQDDGRQGRSQAGAHQVPRSVR